MSESSRICRHCRHWGTRRQDPKSFDVCTAIGGHDSEPPVGVQAYFSNPDAWFLTAPDFGCALFEVTARVKLEDRSPKIA